MMFYGFNLTSMDVQYIVVLFYADLFSDWFTKEDVLRKNSVTLS